MCIDFLDLMRHRALSHLFYEISYNENSILNKCVFTDYIVGVECCQTSQSEEKRTVPYRYRTEQSLRTVTLVHETGLATLDPTM